MNQLYHCTSLYNKISVKTKTYLMGHKIRDSKWTSDRGPVIDQFLVIVSLFSRNICTSLYNKISIMTKMHLSGLKT